MLDFKQIGIIKEELSKDTAKEFVTKIIIEYCSTTQRMSDLLDLIPKIAERGIQERQEKINQYYWALELMIGERCRYPIPKRKSKSKKEYNPDFSTLLYVARAYFPFGNCVNGSKADKEFFEEFISTIKNKQGFDYENSEDWKWIAKTANCEEWFLNVIKQNIDEDFSLERIEKNE